MLAMEEGGRCIRIRNVHGRSVHETHKTQEEEAQDGNLVKWEVADTVVTNGVELHILFRSKNWPKTSSGRPYSSEFMPGKLRIKPADQDPPYLDENLNGTTADVNVVNAAAIARSLAFTASDPGIKTVMTTCFHDAYTDKLKTKSFSAKQYRHLAGRNKMEKRVQFDKALYQTDWVTTLYAEHHFKQTSFQGLQRGGRANCEPQPDV